MEHEHCFCSRDLCTWTQVDVFAPGDGSKKEAARSGKVPMEILEYEELFRKMTHSVRLLFHLGGALPWRGG